MEHLIEFGVFFGKALIVFVSIAGLVLLVVGLAVRNKMKPDFNIEDINAKLDDLSGMMQEVVFDKKALKEAQKARKEKAKKAEKEDEKQRQIFVLNFEGDIKASQVEQFRDEITAILTVVRPGDEAVVIIESPGGTVHGYGLAAAQILRLKKAGVRVIAAVDKVAASGGYMMACTADKILAAPFAIIGSIGVVAQVPNFHKLLKKHDVDYEEIAAGEYKRTVSMLGEITDKGRTKFREQIEDTHVLFKDFVKQNRPQVEIANVATGEYWFGLRAKELNLVDEMMTSDEYLLGERERARIFAVKIEPKRTLGEKLSEMLGRATTTAVSAAIDKFSQSGSGSGPNLG
jgi:serine protease SohB